MLWHVGHKVDILNLCTCLPGVWVTEDQPAAGRQAGPQTRPPRPPPPPPPPLLGIGATLDRSPAKKYETVPPCFPVIGPCTERSLAFLPLPHNWLAVHPSVDCICGARCTCSRLFAPFIWNQIALLMLICIVMLATVAGACNRSATHTHTHTHTHTRACAHWKPAMAPQPAHIVKSRWQYYYFFF